MAGKSPFAILKRDEIGVRSEGVGWLTGRFGDEG